MQNLRALRALPPDPRASGPNPQKSPPLRISGYAPDIWLVSETTHLLYYFSIIIHKFTSTSPGFTHKILFKKLAMENAD